MICKYLSNIRLILLYTQIYNEHIVLFDMCDLELP